jgi:hypothetical protein
VSLTASLAQLAWVRSRFELSSSPLCRFRVLQSTHQTYSQQEYDRTPIDPTGEGSSCRLPGRGERCFDSDGQDTECSREDEDDDDQAEEDADDSEIFRTSSLDLDESEPSTSMFRCYTRSVDDSLDDEDEDDEDGEIQEEGETSDDPSASESLSQTLICYRVRTPLSREREEILARIHLA